MKVLISNEPADAAGVALFRQVPDVEVLLYDPDQPSGARHGEVLIPPYHRSRRALAMLADQPELQCVQLLSAGADRWEPHVPTGVQLFTAAGALAGPVSEWILSALLVLLRRWPALIAHQASRTWAHDLVQADTLSGKRFVVLGAGHIAHATAAKLAAFDAKATLVGRTARGDVHGVKDLTTLLPRHEGLIVAAPLTEQTRGLIDAGVLAELPDHALVVNAGRGPIIQTDALVDELRAGRLLAALDVTDPEPLPQHHPLWNTENLLISPHIARTVPGTAATCYRVAVEQLTAFGASPFDSR